MHHLKVILLLFGVGACVAEVLATNYYCDDRHPQTLISIPNLAGLWYGVEKIFHESKQLVIRNRLTCPAVFITEEEHDDTTYKYGTIYGEGYPYTNTPSLSDYEQRRREGSGGRRYDWPYPTRSHKNYLSHHLHEKYLRMTYEDETGTTEYFLRYNVSRLGFWKSSGPNNGSQLKPQYTGFAGTIQVIKAIGSHLVLTVCHQLPNRELYTLILSRDIPLDNAVIHGVHRLLNRKGLSTSTVQKLCNGAATLSSQLIAAIGLSFVYAIVSL